jgi:predicted flap endonuclease-1-like 5' DNA nuclease
MLSSVLTAASSSAGEAAGTLNPPGSGTLTTIHFVIIAILALATLLIVAVGIAKARKRREGERRSREEAREAGMPIVEAAPPSLEQRDDHIAGQALDRSTFAPEFHAAPVPDDATTEAVLDDAPPSRPVPDERIAAAAPMDASPATIAEPAAPAEPVAPPEPVAPLASAPSPADGPITQLKGLGPKVATRLAEMGVTTVGQIAALDADQAQELDSQLGPFAGRLHRDRWIEQARFLAAGDKAGFEAVFGKL